MNLLDPITCYKTFWPDFVLYDKQVEILRSIQDNDETLVYAANKMGKDYVAAVAAVHWMCSRTPARVVLSSVDGDQLRSVLWAEIKRFVDEAVHPLPIELIDMKMYQINEEGNRMPLSLLECKVAKKGEGMLGRHLGSTDGIPRTLVIFDECSSMDDIAYETAATWADRILMIGNPYPCTNVFYRGAKAGSIKRDDGIGYYRNVMQIKAEDSPNVQLGMAEVAKGLKPSGKTLIPGLIGYKEYIKRRKLWDERRQCIGLDAEFYEGADVFLYPNHWLAESNKAWHSLKKSNPNRRGTAMGVDPAEGGDSTVWTIIDEYGVVEIVSEKTPNTAIIPLKTIQLMAKHQIEPDMVCFDAGGGKTHADVLRMKGYDVRTVGFGESPTLQEETPVFGDKNANKKAFENLRAEMYWNLRELLDPDLDNFEEAGKMFAIGTGGHYDELLRQLSLLPLDYTDKGKFYLPPKRVKQGSKVKSLKSIMGCSPDEADALVLAIHALVSKRDPVVIGGAL